MSLDTLRTQFEPKEILSMVHSSATFFFDTASGWGPVNIYKPQFATTVFLG
jgi:hypothetical protein